MDRSLRDFGVLGDVADVNPRTRQAPLSEVSAGLHRSRLDRASSHPIFQEKGAGQVLGVGLIDESLPQRVQDSADLRRMGGSVSFPFGTANRGPQLAVRGHVWEVLFGLSNSLDHFHHAGVEVGGRLRVTHCQLGQGNSFTYSRGVRLVVQLAVDVELLKGPLQLLDECARSNSLSPAAKDQRSGSGLFDP